MEKSQSFTVRSFRSAMIVIMFLFFSMVKHGGEGIYLTGSGIAAPAGNSVLLLEAKRLFSPRPFDGRARISDYREPRPHDRRM